MNKQARIEELTQLRLTDLWPMFQSATGETTGSPNKKYLARRIAEAEVWQTEEDSGNLEGGPDDSSESAEGIQSEPPTDDSHDEETVCQDAPEVASEDLSEEEATSLAEAPEVAAEAIQSQPEDHPEEEDTGLSEAPEGATEDIQGHLEDENDSEDAAHQEAPQPRLKDLTVDELRELYVEVVGRGTSSTNSAYLQWKIRQAQRGKVPVGPVRRRIARSSGSPSKFKVLPLRFPEETVQALDDVWRRPGFKSRMDLFRRALVAYLKGVGEEEAAGLVEV